MKDGLDPSISHFLLNKTRNGIGVFDTVNLRLVWSNQAFSQKTKFGIAVGGKNSTNVQISDLFALEDMKGILKLINLAKSMGYAYDSEKNLRKGNKRFFPAELNFYRFSEPGKEGPKEYVCLEFVDLSLDKKYKNLQKKESALREDQSELIRNKNIDSLTDLASGIAHEINNPLAIIDGCLEIFKRSLNHEDKSQELAIRMAEKVSIASSRINTLVSGLKGFTEGRNSTGADLNRLEKIIQNIVDLYTEKCSSRGIKIYFENRDGDTKLNCFPEEISQAILHVFKNAYDALENRSNGFIKVEIKQTPSRIEVIFSNNGPVIPEYLKDRILEPFFTTKTVGKASGLGLSIVQGVMNTHHGQLKIEEKDKITIFKLIFPKLSTKLTKAS